MKTQKIVWTTLPNGIDGNRLKISIFVSPRLWTDESTHPILRDFPDFLMWPTKVQAVRFFIEFKGEVTVEAVPDKWDLDAKLWEGIFGEKSPVRPYRFPDFKERIIRTYPARGILSELRKIYESIAESSPGAPPKIQPEAGKGLDPTLKNLLSDMGDLLDKSRDLERHLKEYFDKYKVLDPAKHYDGFSSKRKLDFFQAKRFYDRPEMKEPYYPQPNASLVPPEPKKPELDFHQALAALGDHPVLMRKLGLVLDFTIPRPNGTSSSLRVIPQWGVADHPEDLTPWTHYLLAGDRFIARSRPDSELQNRMLNLKDANDAYDSKNPLYDLVQIDPDGAALKLIHFIAAMVRLFKAEKIPYGGMEEGGLPALRSAGIAVTRFGRADKLHKRFTEMLQKNTDLEKNKPGLFPVELYADDLLRGYRVDILDESSGLRGQWRSLCQRVGAYSFPGPTNESIPVDDEGYVKGASTTSKDGEKSDLYLHEAVFRWDGWSLCAERPGKTLVPKTRIEEVPLFNWDQVPGGESDRFKQFLQKDFGIVWAASAMIKKDANGDTVIAGSKAARKPVLLKLNAERTRALLTLEDGKRVELVARQESDGLKILKRVVKQDEAVAKVFNKAVTEFNFESNFAAKPFSLPRLRFGHTYRVRARTVDLAGNSEPLESKDGSWATGPLFYARYDPLSPPVLVLRDRPSDGESAEKMVIRSTYDQTAQKYVDTEPVKRALTGKGYTYSAVNERHIVPPKTSQLMAEVHGVLDEYIGKGKDYDRGYYISLKEEGTLLDKEIVDIKTGKKVSIPGRDSIEIIETPAGGVPPGEMTGRYVIHGEEQLLLPYLPDPMARGAAFQDLPGAGSPGGGVPGLKQVVYPGLNLNVLLVPFDSTWPEAAPFRIRIAERPGRMIGDNCEETFDDANTAQPGAPAWDPVNRILTVCLGKAQTARVRYSSFLSEEDLEKMGVWKWLSTSAKLEELKKRALCGSHWMLTPFRELVLVHAVQQPLCQPRMFNLDVRKPVAIGCTHATIKADLHLSAKSTGKIELLAKWENWVDDLEALGPKRVEGKAPVFEMKIDESSPDKFSIDGNTPPLYRHEFGDTKYRRIQYKLRGTTRFREFFPPEITQDLNNITREGPSVEVPILNSDRPAAPKVHYVIPFFEWKIPTTAPGIERWVHVERKRVGGGLRVYLGRPWYSSGDDELLGVILWPDPAAEPPEEIKPYVTHFGRDPIWNASAVTMGLTPGDFLRVRRSGVRLTLDEVLSTKVIYGPKVSVVGFMPEYDWVRRLWFCDIQLNMANLTSYYPFVRLALARYQPNSICKAVGSAVLDANLSRVVVADFAQLVPDRTLEITFRDEIRFDISVSGYGVFKSATNRLEVGIQTRDPQIPGELGWVPIEGTADQPNPCPLLLNPRAGDGTTRLWKWERNGMRLPAPRRAKPFRIVVREYEIFESDFPELQRVPRIVYADAVDA